LDHSRLNLAIKNCLQGVFQQFKTLDAGSQAQAFRLSLKLVVSNLSLLAKAPAVGPCSSDGWAKQPKPLQLFQFLDRQVLRDDQHRNGRLFTRR
jgi:hypothetical protein